MNTFVDRLLISIETQNKRAVSGITEIDKILLDLDKQIKKVNGGFNTFDMRLLSTMFFGMQLQRTFGGMFRSILGTFFKAEDQTSGLTQATTRLNAAWEFMKFSIMDALNTDFFIAVIDGVVKFIDWISQLSSAWKITFLAITGGLYLIGSGLFTISQFKLFWNSVFGMGGFLNETGTMNTTLFGATGVLTKLKNFAIVGVAIKAVFDLDAYTKGETGLRGLIDALGLDLSLIGLVSGKPWIVAIGLLPQLLPYGTKIKNIGMGLVERGIERQNWDKVMSGKGEIGDNWGLLAGGLQSGIGMVVQSTGQIIEYTDKYLESLDKTNTNVDTLTSSISNNLLPGIVDMTKKMKGEPPSLDNSLQSVSTSMNNMSTTYTEEFVNASDTRIAQMNDEISKLDEWSGKLDKWKTERDAFMGSLRNSSSVSD